MSEVLTGAEASSEDLGISADVDSFLALAEMSGPDEMRRVVSRAYEVIAQMLESVREGRDLIERTAVRKLHVTEAKLHEISDTTETAAFDMLDGLDRSLLLVHRLEMEELGGQPTVVSAELREEIYALIGHLQFQDITSQQLNHASSVLREMERHLADFVRLFGASAEPNSDVVETLPRSAPSFDPAATLDDVADRQELVDRLISSSKV